MSKHFLHFLIVFSFFFSVPIFSFAQTPPTGDYRLVSKPGIFSDTPEWFCGPNEVVAYPSWDKKKEHPFCKPVSCASSERLCPAGDKPFCCPTSWQCGVENKDVAPGWYPGKLMISAATCLPPDPPKDSNGQIVNPQKYTACGPTSGNNKMAYCLNATQECVETPMGSNKFKHCQPKGASSCAPGEKFVSGTKDFSKEKRCCPKDTTETTHPNGMPFCAKNAGQANGGNNNCPADKLNTLASIANSYSGTIWGVIFNDMLGTALNSCSDHLAGVAAGIGGPFTPPSNPSTPTNPVPPVDGSNSTPAANPIRPDFVVFLPHGGEVWPIGSTKEINWSETNYVYSPGLYKIYASTRDGSWYGLINQTGERSLNWQVGKVTVNGVTKTLSPGNYWIQVIKQDGSGQAFSAGSVELTGTATAPIPPTLPTLPPNLQPPVTTPSPTLGTLQWTMTNAPTITLDPRTANYGGSLTANFSLRGTAVGGSVTLGRPTLTTRFRPQNAQHVAISSYQPSQVAFDTVTGTLNAGQTITGTAIIHLTPVPTAGYFYAQVDSITTTVNGQSQTTNLHFISPSVFIAPLAFAEPTNWLANVWSVLERLFNR